MIALSASWRNTGFVLKELRHTGRAGALSGDLAMIWRRHLGPVERSATQLDAGHNIGSRPPNPLNEIVAAAEEIENRLAGLDTHFRALNSISGA